MVNENFFAYLYQDDRYTQAIRLVGRTALLEFLQDNLYAEDLRICDASDQLLCQLVDGVDLINKLEEVDIDLYSIFHPGERDADFAGENSGAKENWEVLYDQIGLSPTEKAMRQRINQAARDTRTVTDVARLVRNTYFTAFFYSADDTNAWGYFDDQDFSVSVFVKAADGADFRWEDTEKLVKLSPQARVRHRSSSEDKHHFTLLDPPEI
jgi:hypothetical protein